MSTQAVITQAQSVTPNDTLGLSFASTWISLGVAGAVAVDMAGGQKNIVLTLPAGLYNIGVTKVYATGTTATGIAVYY